jgi:hypothetical protein
VCLIRLLPRQNDDEGKNHSGWFLIFNINQKGDKRMNTLKELDIEKVRRWLSIVNPYMMVIREPVVYEEMRFPSADVRNYITKHEWLSLNNRNADDTYGVSDGVMVRVLAQYIGADTSVGDMMICHSNKIQAWWDACIEALDKHENTE